MNGKTGVFAGTFDPFTYGHMNIVKECLSSFDRIVIGILDNPDKKCMFEKSYRLKMIKCLYAGNRHIDVRSFSGLAVDFIRLVNGNCFIRGYRNDTDLEYEKNMREYNFIHSGYDTLLVNLTGDYADVSSTKVRNIILSGQDYSGLVPARIKNMIDRYFDK